MRVPDHPDDLDPDEPGWSDAAATFVFILVLLAAVGLACSGAIYFVSWLAGAGWEAAT